MDEITVQKAGRRSNSELDLEMSALSGDIKVLNARISDYNTVSKQSPSDPQQTWIALHDIHAAQQAIEQKYSEEIKNNYTTYGAQVYGKLFADLKAGYLALGKQAFTDQPLPEKSITVEPRPPASFSEILAKMDPDKVNTLFQILSKKKFSRDSIRKLYKQQDSPEAQELGVFLKTHSISFLGGGNSRNFKIKDNKTGKAEVLKVENKFLDTKRIDEHNLRAGALQGVLTQVSAPRRAQFSRRDKGGTSIRTYGTVCVTEYCPLGDLESQSKKRRKNSEKIASAVQIYSQMAQILRDTEKSGYFFPDMKNANWLQGEDGKLRISDGKSLIAKDKGVRSEKSYEAGLISFPAGAGLLLKTEYISANYMSGQIERMYEDKSHLHMLGKNLYQYLTGCSLEKLGAFKNDDSYFKAKVFQSEDGKALRKLITGMVSGSLTLEKAQTELEKISLQKDLKALEKFKFGAEDTEMATFLSRMQSRLAAPDITLADLQGIKSEIDNIRNDPVISQIRRTIKDYKSGIFMGAQDKIKNIEMAMAKIPLAERKNIFSDNPSSAAIAVQNALAQKRYFKGKEEKTLVNEKGACQSPQNTAKSFQTLKERIALIREKETAKAAAVTAKNTSEALSPPPSAAHCD
ncbi:MAG: hypothetical protein Q8R79_06985 [Legionellaceae bacterium]|nr:hypothetical protein [Legionellaceae bacterium]